MVQWPVNRRGVKGLLIFKGMHFGLACISMLLRFAELLLASLHFFKQSLNAKQSSLLFLACTQYALAGQSQDTLFTKLAA